MAEEQGQTPVEWERVEEAFAQLPPSEQQKLLRRLQERQRAAEYYYEPSPATESVEVLELMVPERLEYLPELVEFLRAQLKAPAHSGLFAGYSILEAKGAFRGERIYDEPTLIMRLIYDRTQFVEEEREEWVTKIDQRMNELAHALIRITQQQEEEIWILRYTATVAKYIRREREA